MDDRTFQQAADLAEKLGHVFVATAGEDKLPHLAAAAELSRVSDEEVMVTSWFCPGTVANLQVNRRVAVVVWDPEKDDGYQLLGEVQHVDDLAMMDGYDPEVESDPPIPQVERGLLVRVHRIVRFSHAPHSDVEQ